jgi:hypothetical protein
MSSVDMAPGEIPAGAEDVAGCCSAACWSVEDRAWKQLHPGLPDEVIALLAPPVVVCVETLGAQPTTDPPPVRRSGAHRAEDAAAGRRPETPAPPAPQPRPQPQPQPESQSSQASTLEPWPAWPSRAVPVLMAQVDQSLRFLAPAPPYRNNGRHSARC